MRLHSTLVIIILVCHAIPSVLASWGNVLYEYLRCFHDCRRKCDDVIYPGKLPLSLRIFGWTCLDECKYTCMHEITANDVANDRPIKQFYGKWPFVRFLGVQEPASTLFSILNGLGHILGWRAYRSVIPQNYKMYNVWKCYMLVNVNAWIWSTIFHTRDLNFTEKMDYFCATSLVLSSIFCFFVRAVGPESRWKCSVFGVIVLIMFCCHVGYLGFIKFDYGYNIKANVTIGIINMVGWLSWCLKNYNKQKYVWKCIFITITVFLLLGLEVFDFPPIWWTFDAHSLWHLGTVPLGYFWYRFLIDDSKYHIQQDVNKRQ
ncbi:post-GPI attachment to proteins factor 3 isoform X2 [Exaiptasia diaphana]|nr:post-GPI attachment to proteins factor 3 isoform X2 [Exaiptasia diaphana]XP_020900696.1 post-GPI attachment to proteins factor 3 isoform X2 [Exaiptasia diaphana]